MAEQLICNQWVGGSIPFAGSKKGDMERFPSGQREQTVNLPAQPSEVRILPSPPFCISCDKNSNSKIKQLLGDHNITDNNIISNVRERY